MIKKVFKKLDAIINKDEYIFALILSIFISISSEIISRNDTVLPWILSNPTYFIISIVFLWAFITLLSTLVLNHRIGSTLTVLIILILSLLSSMKYARRGLPLIPVDIYLVDEALNIKNVVNFLNYIYHFIFITIATITTYFAHKYFVHKKSLTKKFSLVNFIISILIIASLFFLSPLYSSEYLPKGFVLNFAFDSPSLAPENKLSDNNPYLLKDFLDGVKDQEPINSRPDKKPNIIVIMNESFWDINLLRTAEITPNPLAIFEKLKEESIYGMMESPVYAGGTSNAEFEVMTGYSTHFFNEGYMLYTQELKHPYMSLASVLRSQDYKTVGIHPFWGWYYNRNEVYKYLGFDEFITEEYLSDLKRKGYYISDDVVTNTIIDKLEENTDPSFIFAVTMQNHGPYDDDRYKEMFLDVEVSKDLENEDRKILQTYAQGIYDADQALGELVDYIKGSDEPTILLFFGDHLPLLGENYKLYKDLGHITGKEPASEEHIKLKTTPFIIWSNFSEISKNINIIDATYLGPYLLNEAQVDIPNYYKHLLQLYNEFPVINNKFGINSNGEHVQNDKKTYNDFNNRLKSLEYDMMYGNKTVEPSYYEWIVTNNSNFNSEINNIAISKVYVDGDDLVIEGKNLYPKGILYINKKELEYTYHSTNKIVVKDFSNQVDSNILDINFKLIDTIEKVLAEGKYRVELK